MHSGRLFLARDRSGIKPLYYSLDRKRLRFASTSQALIASGGIDTSIDAFALHHHLTLHAVVPAPRTIMKGIRKLPPATTLSFNTDGSHQFHTYWQLDARRLQTDKSEQDWIDELHVTLRQAVNRQSSAADVPVGVLLSGGLDSSLLVGLLAESGVRDIHTFSIGFEDVGEERADEFEYSDQVVERFQTRHHRYRIPNSEVLTRLPEAVAQMSEPMVGQDAVAFYLLSERVAREDKAVLSGQGADEVFAGYFWYPLMQAELGLPIQRFAKHYFDRNHAEYLETVERGLYTPDVTSHLIAHRLGMPNADTFMDQVLRLDTTTLIVDDPVKRVDNMTMAWGLEARVPFLDHELIELAARMPPELKLKNGGKFPLKAIARGLIPDSIIDRPKGYFPVPALKYVRGGFHDLMQDTLNSQACRSRGLFQRAYVDKLLAAPEKYFTPIRGAKLWHLALLELWLQLNVDGKA
jgi:asparagine synthase (glutamine-hydrolysing)